jgi:putative transposase
VTHHNDYTLPESITATLIEQGWAALLERIKVVVDQAMHEEQNRYLQAEDYERIETRQGYANGYKPKRVKTRMGAITFSLPQVQGAGKFSAPLSFL